MQSFEIQLLEDRFQVEHLENGLYRIMESENKLGVICAIAEGDQVKCSTQDELEGRLDLFYISQLLMFLIIFTLSVFKFN